MNATLKLPIEPWARRLVLLEIALPVVLLVLGIYAGLLQVLFRAGVIQAAEFWGWEYYQALTLHGVVNAIVFTTFFAVAFGNALVPYALGTKLPLRWAWVSGIMMIVGTLMAAWAILAGKASVLYTFYPPLMAHPFFYLGAALLIIGSWIAFFNWIPLYLRWRREHPGEKTPLAVVGMFATFIVWLIATVAVAIEVVVLLLPWSLGWTQEVNVPLARMLFWFSGIRWCTSGSCRHTRCTTRCSRVLVAASFTRTRWRGWCSCYSSSFRFQSGRTTNLPSQPLVLGRSCCIRS